MKLFDKTKAENLWYICSDQGEMNGEFTVNPCELKGNGYTIRQTVDKSVDGVYSRQDILQNSSDSARTFSCVKSRFVMDAGDYEVYTQYNSWMNESRGSWQPLITEISAHSASVRTSHSANPFIAIWNNQTNRGIAFHLLPKSTWEMRVSRVAIPGPKSFVQVEMGINAPNFSLKLAPGEILELPQILYYEITSKIDLDCYKLHRYCLDHFPAKRLPVMYNTWLYKFDKLTVDNTLSQIPLAAKLGAEYFVIDAGWFGKDPVWCRGIGDWVESLTFGYKGRMTEIGDSVRDHGMKFGLWLEVERAVDGAEVLKTHGDFFIHTEKNGHFLNYADEAARDYIFDVTCGVIEKYGVEYIKFDFNADLFYDSTNMAFLDYFKGYAAYIQRLRERYTDLYIDNCASGGMRMNLVNCRDFDSFWHSDCQSVHEGMRLFKDAILRLPPQVFDRWASIESVKNVLVDDDGLEHNHIISTSDAIWQQIEGVQMSCLKGFLSGGPLGFSCDLTQLSELHFRALRDHVAKFKADREFWARAECRISVDTGSLFVLEFRNRDLSRIITQIYVNHVIQKGIWVYPQVDPDKIYLLSSGETVKGSTLMEEGHYVQLELFPDKTISQLELTEI